MKIKIKQVSTPIAGYTDYWSEEWFISVDKKTIAVTWTEKDAKLLVKALRQLNKKKLIRK